MTDGNDPDPADDGAPADVPMADVAREIRDRRDDEDRSDDPFERVEPDEVDRERIWAKLAADAADDRDAGGSGPRDLAGGPASSAGAAQGDTGCGQRRTGGDRSGGASDPTAGADDGGEGGDGGEDERVIDKREYCQRCRHFADPPDAVCTRGGTEIVEVVDSGRFRVRNCPVVAGEGPDEDADPEDRPA